MQLHTIHSRTPRKKSKYVGRGGKRGTTSGRGTKGQRARAGHKIRPELRDVIKRIPKLRGYRFHGVSDKNIGVNLDVIQARFNAGETVSKETLRKKNLLPKSKMASLPVKILGDGALKKKMTFKGLLYSKNARAKIEEAGGTIQ